MGGETTGTEWAKQTTIGKTRKRRPHRGHSRGERGGDSDQHGIEKGTKRGHVPSINTTLPTTAASEFDFYRLNACFSRGLL